MGSHGYFLQLQGGDPEVGASLGRGEIEGAVVSPEEKSLLELVRTVTLHAYRTTDEEVERVRQAGWTEPQIAEAIYVTALFAFYNRVADAFGLEDPGFFDNPPPRAAAERA